MKEVLFASFFYSTVIPLLAWIGKFFFHMLVLNTHVINQGRIEKINEYMSHHGWCSTRSALLGSPPGPGLHFFFVYLRICKYRIPWPVIVKYELIMGKGCYDESYDLYNPLRLGCKEMQQMLLSEDKKVDVCYIYSLGPEKHKSAINKIIPYRPNSIQKRCVQDILKYYRKNSHATALICGPPGIGKSETAFSLAERMEQELKVKPTVYMGYNPAQPGWLFDSAVSGYEYKSPAIVLLEEFDEALAQVEINAKTEKGKYGSHCNSKAALNHLLDRFARTSYLIILMSSNVKLAELKEKYSCFLRKGRLDLSWQF